MTPSSRILLQSLVRPFYRQNAGQLIFVFILFFGAVGELEGTQIHTGPLYQFHYQYALILGMLSSHTLFGFVLLAWLLYAEKCTRFVLSALQQSDYSFLDLLNNLSPAKIFRIFFRLQLLLFLPIVLYSLAIITVAVYKGWLFGGLLVVGYILAVCMLAAARCQYQLRHPGRTPWLLLPSLPGVLSWWKLFIRYLVREHRLLLAGIKIVSCGMLYISVKTITQDNYDLRMPSLLYGIGIFGHSILVYKFRELEEKNLLFYRGLPISLPARLIQYGLLYAVLLIPEMITLALLTPMPLHPEDAFRLLLSGYSLLLLLNSLLFVGPFPIKTFLKIVLALFLLLYFAVMAGFLGWLSVCILAGALALFGWRYYRYDAAA
ncbi:MAG TPA: hypothetical protein VNS58_02455 [Puia sp.]|nr:hypothetical protein [Puia sp.]